MDLLTDSMKKELWDIYSGKINSWRHCIYRDGPPNKRAGLMYSGVDLGFLTKEQYEEICNGVLKMFCNKNMKLFRYAMDVIVPEAIVRMHMNHFSVDYKKAEHLMYTVGYKKAEGSGSETESDCEMAINPRKKRKLLEISRRFTSEVEKALESPEDSPLAPPSTSFEGSSVHQPSTLIARGKELQLKQKKLFGSKKGKGSMPKNRNIPVSICKMKKGRAGTYVRDGMSIELIANVFDSHDEVLKKAQSAFHLKMRQGEGLALFTVSGALIQGTDEWTLHSYLQQTHKSDAKLGIGYIELLDEDEQSSESGSSFSNENGDDELQLPYVSLTSKQSLTGKKPGTSEKSSMLHTNKPSTSLTNKPGTSLTNEKPGTIVLSEDDTGYSGTTIDGENIPGENASVKKEETATENKSDASKKGRQTALSSGFLPRSSLPRSSRHPGLVVKEGKCMQFAGVDLANATKNYNRKSLLGKGGFGSVYKGCLSGGLTVAIKVLTQEGQQALLKSTGSQLQTEVDALTRFRHPNIVQMYGCCPKPPALIYELMINGSLFDKLHNVKDDQSTLEWKQRLTIMEDACKGMFYLHNAKPPLVHQDIKSANILLDANMTAKLADFGFAIELPTISHGKTMFSVPFVARSEGYYAS